MSNKIEIMDEGDWCGVVFTLVIILVFLGIFGACNQAHEIKMHQIQCADQEEKIREQYQRKMENALKEAFKEVR